MSAITTSPRLSHACTHRLAVHGRLCARAPKAALARRCHRAGERQPQPSKPRQPRAPPAPTRAARAHTLPPPQRSIPIPIAP